MKIFCEMDYGQIEARVIAMFSKDKVFVKALWERYDVHSEWCERIAKAYPAWVTEPIHEFHTKPIFKKYRDKSKNKFVFPLFFGATLYKTAGDLGIPVDVLKPIYEEFWKTFEGVKDYQDKMMQDYRNNGYVECLTGRRRRAPLSYNQVINSPIQGTASDIVVDGMNRLSELDLWEYQTNLNIHDSLTFILEEEELETHSEVIIREMLNCRFPWINVPLTVEMSIGVGNWSNMEAVGDYSSDEWLDWPKRPEYV